MNKKWSAKAYDEIKIMVYKNQKEKIKAHAEKQGESVNGFIHKAIVEKIERELRQSP